MTQWPRSVAVVGAGVMGVQIAALLSAAGKRVFLLDIDEDGMPSGSKARNAIVLAESKNSPFYSSIHASSIECGSIADISASILGFFYLEKSSIRMQQQIYYQCP